MNARQRLHLECGILETTIDTIESACNRLTDNKSVLMILVRLREDAAKLQEQVEKL